MDIYKPQQEKQNKLAYANNLDSLKEAIADFYFREEASSVIVNPDGSVSLINKNGSISSMTTRVKQVTRNQRVTGYVFLSH